MRAYCLVVLSGLLLAATPASAEIYRYIDASGREHFTTSLDQVPKRYRLQAIDRAKEASKRVNVVGGDIDKRGKSRSSSSDRYVNSSQSTHPGKAPTADPSSEGYWRRAFANKRKAIQKAEASLRSAEKADRLADRRDMRRRGRIYSDRRNDRVERAEERVRRAEEAMFDLRRHAGRQGVPAHWMN